MNFLILKLSKPPVNDVVMRNSATLVTVIQVSNEDKLIYTLKGLLVDTRYQIDSTKSGYDVRIHSEFHRHYGHYPHAVLPHDELYYK